MRRLPIAALAALASALLAGAPTTRAADTKPDAGTAAPATSASSTLPFNPFANAKKGDWAILYECVKVRTGKGSAQTVWSCFGTTVESVEDNLMTLERIWSDDKGEIQIQKLKFSTVVTPTLEDLAPLVVRGRAVLPRLTNVKIEDEPHKLEHHEFPCKKITFDVATGDVRRGEIVEHVKEIKVSIWISPEVKGCGIVAAQTEHRGEVNADRPDGFKTHATIKHVLAGHGGEQALGWGKRVENVLLELKEWNKDRSLIPGELHFDDDPKPESGNASGVGAVTSTSCPRLPWNPFAKAEKGDWSVVYTTLKIRAGEETATVISCYSTMVEEVDGDTVMLIKVWKDDQSGNVLGQHFTFSKKEAPTLDEFFMVAGAPGPVTGDVKFEDEKRTAGGTERECKKVTYKSQSDGRTFTVSAWLSPETKAGALVGLTTEHDGKIDLGHGSKKTVMAVLSTKQVVAGFGPGGKLDWGVGPVEVAERIHAWKGDPKAVPRELLIEDEPATGPEKK